MPIQHNNVILSNFWIDFLNNTIALKNNVQYNMCVCVITNQCVN